MSKIQKPKKEYKPNVEKEDDDNKKTIIVIIIALIVILGLIIGGVIYFNSKDDEKGNDDNTSKKKLVKGKTLKTEEELEQVTGALAIIDETSPSINISGDTYQTRVIDTSVTVKDNEELSTVEYGFSSSSTKAPNYTKVTTNVNKYEKDIIHDTGTNNYKVSYLWVKATDSEGNVSVEKKQFITAQYLNSIPNGTTNVSGDLIINKSGTNLNGITVNGSIYITKNVGLGDVTLTNVIVKKNIYVNGGGTNSIYLNNVKVANKIIVNNENHVRLNFENITTKITVDLNTDTTIQTDGTTNKNINVNVLKDITVLINGNIGKMYIKGNANVQDISKDFTSRINRVDMDENSAAVVMTYVDYTTYDAKTNKGHGLVYPLAELTVNIYPDGDVTTTLQFNRDISVSGTETVTDTLEKDKEIIAAIETLKKDNVTGEEWNKAIAVLGENNIIVVVRYKDASGIDQVDVQTAQRGDFNDNGTAVSGTTPTYDGADDENTPGTEYDTTVNVGTDPTNVKVEVVVTENGNAYWSGQNEPTPTPTSAPTSTS